VDVHTHSDFTLPVRPAAAAKLLQGVTTDVTGNCGFSPFPLGDDARARRHGAFLEPSLRERWPTCAAYAGALRDRGVAINVAPLVGLGAVRVAVMGDERRPPRPSELDAMRTLVAGAMAGGAFGASSGLVYAPSGFAEADELATLVGEVGVRGGLYATHMRDEGTHLEAAVAEALETARRAGCRLQISHLKAFGRANWGKVDAALAAVEAANAAGGDVAVDVYPYTAGATTLAGALPPDVLAGGEEAMRARLGDPDERARIAAAAGVHSEGTLDDIILGVVPSRPAVAGRRLVDVAAADGVAPAELLLRVVERDGVGATMIVGGMAEDDVRRVIAHPCSTFGSDGWTMAVDAEPYTHPRSFAAAVRLLAAYVRDGRVLTLAAAARKLAAAPAARLGLSDRGTIAAGAAADLVVVDLERLEERATFADPCRHPRGVDHVLVNGVPAVCDGELTGARGGRVLERP
jgi:N-acyl-D-amino-acid deacylase